jgi:hypothetical protein
MPVKAGFSLTKFGEKIKPFPAPARNKFESVLLTTFEEPPGKSQRPANWLAQQLWPEFEELPVGLMAFTMLIMVLLETDLQNLFLAALEIESNLFFLLILLNIVVFGVLSIFHVFSKRQKTDQEKRGMVGFAIFCCIISGVMGGYRLYLEQSSWLQIFGVWNVIQGLAAALLFHAKAINENSLSDENAPLAGTIANFVLVGTLYIFLKFGFNLHYIDSFSICVAYAMSLSSAVCAYIYRLPDQSDDC